MHILVIDDHSLFLDGMQMILTRLGPETKVTAINRSLDALNLLDRTTDFDLIIIDIHMPNLDGVSLLNALQNRQCLVPVVVVSATQNEIDIQQALQHGALGFIPKSFGADELVAAISQVLQGKPFIPESLAHLLDSQEKTDTSGISIRQKEVLILLEQGQSNKQIAATLNISESTVKNHVYALFQRFAVNNRTECINAARNQGILGDNNPVY